ncbi:MAG: preprotein translocase subunit SecA [Oscillospiraceae bacterium]|jgi:preprotein translocase subunit SecA|nr:preprotein translocase subunit SecA [Oscillospiraceae bacterium]
MKKTDLNISAIRDLAKESVTDILKKTRTPESILAACSRATLDSIGVSPFDEQLIAAYEIYAPSGNKSGDGCVIEMATGEGKTFAGVYAAALLCYLRESERSIFSLGSSVHILTFNDYLSERDFNWTKPIYDELNLTTGLITEKTPRAERKQIYAESNVIYASAKEVGFDYLRDFAIEDDILDIRLDCVIVDEADSIMIDEGNVPLVIAGEYPNDESIDITTVADFVKSLTGKDYALPDDQKDIFLTDSGIEKAEQYFKVDNLYDSENEKLLSDINNLLEAYYLLAEDKDYIVKDGRILIIDSFTGRVAENRNYRASLQAAVQYKHGLEITPYTRVIGNTPIQFFLREYDFLSGMTGTAQSSEAEFELMYGLKLRVIEPRLPSKRVDNPTEIYFNRNVKYKKILDEIVRRHETGQPLLIGADDIESAERLGKDLAERGIKNNVLTAKNDYDEAEIIKNAGAFGAVTVSANMSGRGVDIVLGRDNQKQAEDIKSLGGLCVISCSLRESSRLNRQLSGRAGRQGDPGEALTFAALDDPIMLNNGLPKLIPKKRYADYTEEQLTYPDVVRETARIQRISEGERLEERRRMLKFTVITEKHRDIVFSRRKEYVSNAVNPDFWEINAAAEKKFGKAKIVALQKKCAAAAICEEWVRYLEFVSDLKAGIHLTSVGGKVPHEEFNVECERFFEGFEAGVEEIMARYAEQFSDIDSLDEFEFVHPKNIKSYMLNETADELVKFSFATWIAGDAPQLIDKTDNIRNTDDTSIDNTSDNAKKAKRGLLGIFGKGK